ncbi:MAG TPA: hypothetical protein VEA60_05975 [Allosphingosinicella sp.]|nr:hypothetical protein [Allosphingosinicella sp.]
MARLMLAIGSACALAACGPPAPAGRGDSPANEVATSGKRDVALADVPAEVLAAAAAAQPGFTPAEAQAETRDGRDYFDIGGKLADGSEVEFDIVRQDGRWRVVETQRDIALASAPAAVRGAAGDFPAARVIESRQDDALVIYELYDSKQRKLEIKWDGKRAERLTEEWAH